MRFPGRPIAEPGEDLALRFPRTMLASARRILVLTGAGIYGRAGRTSPPSGTPTRSPSSSTTLWRF